jgi:hypothetical protein
MKVIGFVCTVIVALAIIGLVGPHVIRATTSTATLVDHSVGWANPQTVQMFPPPDSPEAPEAIRTGIANGLCWVFQKGQRVRILETDSDVGLSKVQTDGDEFPQTGKVWWLDTGSLVIEEK